MADDKHETQVVLEELTVGELFEEISRRNTAAILVVMDDSDPKNEDASLYYLGGVHVCHGLTGMALESFKSVFRANFIREDEED